MTKLPNISTFRGRVSRRGFLAGAIATGALAACGSDSGSSNSDGTAGGAADSVAGSTAESASTETSEQIYTLIQRFPQTVQVPGPTRLPISLSTGSAQIIDDGPEILSAQVTDFNGDPIGERISAVRRDVAPGPYYDFRPVMDDVGFYQLRVDGGPVDGASFEILDPDLVPVPLVGQDMPAFDTPTFDNPAGVDPICTREPEACPFHDVTLTDALAAGKPVVYLIGTPAFCSTGSCAPALESLIDVQDQFGDTFTFVHAEVYTDDTATTIAPAVDAASLTYEPVLFVTDANGVVVERLDAVWDETELVEVLTKAST
ncbi:MAG: hypothetical protein DRJ50_06295 [Actinobacteria bacterium]|nr:MAG: hypothetical protein DRJ50_06295 [Actinomycetota bacterium]